MTQKDLFGLIGLKSTDPALIGFFSKYELEEPPQNMAGNEHTKIITDEKHRIYFAFSYEIIHEKFYPPILIEKEQPQNSFLPYVCAVGIRSGIEPSARERGGSARVRDVTPSYIPVRDELGSYYAGFWNVTPSYTATEDELTSYYGVPQKAPVWRFIKNYSKDFEIIAFYDPLKKVSIDIELRIKEYRDILRVWFGVGDGLQDFHHIYAMLVKWLFDNRYLRLDENLYAQGLINDKEKVLDFIHTHLKGRVWDCQLIDEPFLIGFLYTTLDDSDIETADGPKNYYFRRLLLISVGRWGNYQDTRETPERENALRELLFDDRTYLPFRQIMDETFEVYRQLRKR